MRDDDDFEDIDAPDFEEPPLDKIAARAASYTKLLALYDHIKDDDAKKEALLMLRAIRRSFKTIPTADDVTPIISGKQ